MRGKGERGYGIVVVAGLLGGFAIGTAMGQTTAGTLIGGGVGLLAAFLLSLRG